MRLCLSHSLLEAPSPAFHVGTGVFDAFHVSEGM
jgi:hypothetical protein